MNFDLATALVLSGFIGLALGLLGTGGTIITLPVLVYVAGFSVVQSVPMSMAVVGGASVAGSVLQWRRGLFALRTAAMFAVTGMIGAFAGAQFTRAFSPSVLMLVFAALMLVVGVTMLRRPRVIKRGAARSPFRCGVAGAAVGVVTGFLGVGGGFLIVPALARYGGLDMKKAVGTSLGVIGLNSLAGLAGQLRHVRVDWGITVAFLAVAIVGMALGVSTAGHLSDYALRRAFAWFILAVALVVGCKNGMTLLAG